MRLVEPGADARAPGAEHLVDDGQHALVAPHVPAVRHLVAQVERVELQDALAAGAPLREVGVELGRALEPDARSRREEEREQRLELVGLEQRHVERVLEVGGAVGGDDERGAAVGSRHARELGDVLLRRRGSAR